MVLCMMEKLEGKRWSTIAWSAVQTLWERPRTPFTLMVMDGWVGGGGEEVGDLVVDGWVGQRLRRNKRRLSRLDPPTKQKQEAGNFHFVSLSLQKELYLSSFRYTRCLVTSLMTLDPNASRLPVRHGVIKYTASDREFLLRMSYMEIYNEEINDLLAPEHRKLQIHESLERGIFVAGLREEIVASPEQVLEFMEFGECELFNT
ncbi:hypothetical protein RHGRI_024517 [Rhododendron griersonianum]|uniref:Kinesin motor domain-containing protein n=1 Tax=Rhododendron griersonianum TaxID=479676 RepID=A0AAV6J7K6_9ERIC|nr:hypothetical protein RHGRI_024517 [Rhododendron griersonianum]